MSLESDMQTCKKTKSVVLGTALSLILVSASSAATSAWNVGLTFDAFAGQAGGFADDTGGPIVLRDQANPGIVSRDYDVVSSAGTNAAGQSLYSLGQDGVKDVTIRTLMMDGSEGRWAKIAAEQRRGTLRMNTLVDAGTSRSGDFALVAYEVTFNSNLGVSGDQLSVRLTSTNGSTQLYEWAFITAGGLDDAPFSPQQLMDYSANIYHAGTPQLTGNGEPLPTGRSISQEMAGLPASPAASGGQVANGWWAIDDFNTRMPNGSEDLGVIGGDGRIDDNQTVTGTNLGLTGQPLTSFTVWFGLHDVAFDTNGDGFTATEASPQSSIAGMSFGTNLLAVPEPSALMLLLGSVAVLLRRKRP